MGWSKTGMQAENRYRIAATVRTQCYQPLAGGKWHMLQFTPGYSRRASAIGSIRLDQRLGSSGRTVSTASERYLPLSFSGPPETEINSAKRGFVPFWRMSCRTMRSARAAIRSRTPLMKIATYNVNSIRRRLPLVLDWIASHKPDVMCLQETKVQDQDFPVDAFRGAGYHATIAA